VHLTINSLGTAGLAAALSRAAGRVFSRARASALDEDSRRRLLGNPLRILDSKNPQMAALIEAAPLLSEYLDEESQLHFAELRAALDSMSIPYVVNPRLVRGLDYYSRTVFEWITDALGAQDAVCSGGRYDGLIAQLGGEATPAIGFALGIERVVALIAASSGSPPAASAPDVYLVVSGARAQSARRCAWPSNCAMPCPDAACHAQSGRRQFQDAVSPCRSQRRTAGCDPGR
jgi:histidyl-tRNA synthetase